MPLDSLAGSDGLLYAAIIAIAFFIRGIAGFGSGLIAIPLLALSLPLEIVVPVIALLDYAAAAGHGIHHRENIVWRDLLPLTPFTLLGAVSALYLLHNIDTEILKKVLGGFILLYALYMLSGLSPQKKRSLAWAAPFGAVGGLISTLFGTGGPFYVIYLHLRAQSKSEFRATVALAFLMDGAIRIVGYLVTGLFDLDITLMVLAALPIMLGSMYLGSHIHTSLSHQAFQRLISLLLIGSGLALLIR